MKAIFFFIIILLSLFCPAQNLDYKHNIHGGIFLHTKGWGGTLRYYKTGKYNKNTIIDFDIITIKHPKEIKQVYEYYEDAKPYVYGKLNNIILLRAMLGKQFLIADKERPMSIRVNYNVSLGPTMALLNPVYLNILIDLDSNGYFSRVEEQRFDPVKHYDQSYIFGGASYFKGFADMSYTFGACLKTSLSFEWGNYYYKIKSLEVGFMLDYFPDKLPIFAYINNESYFINLYFNFTLGLRKL